ncbi:MAG: tRNA (adenosine(37)-N6)-threonylcarbamoyltransferase complex ATPase subunit type 1 TsaE [Pirellulales bacterium]|nr:tRNA (adenosine(37)-N6)-threonylcarbamoyltransferase complex ATPase subunit type 1 TsaE [Pirellulales bacterium]
MNPEFDGSESFIFTAADESQTATLGTALAEVLPAGTTVALSGTLGAGKTRLVQAVAGAAGVNPREVVSPTFVLIQEYSGRRKIVHVDAYRLKDVDEFFALGPEEYFASDALVLVEWADRVLEALPAERIDVHIEVLGTTRRRFEIRAVGEKYREVIADLRSMLPDGGSC